MIQLIDLNKQYETIKPQVDAKIQEVIQSNAFIQGKYAAEFDKKFAASHAISHCISCSNGTTALQLALMAAGIKEGDEVITTTNTFIATAEAICHVGAKPVLVDIHPETYNMDVSKIEAAITPRTKAIIPVHIYGNPVNMGALMKLAHAKNLMIFEDCAQAHLAKYDGKTVGSFGVAGTFSFYPGKNLGAFGDAGAVVTNSNELAAKMRMLLDHGRSEKYYHNIIGYNFRMDGIQAAILSTKLEHLQKWTQLRQKWAALYTEILSKRPEIITPKLEPKSEHVFHIYALQLDNRDLIAEKLKAKGIATGIHYPIPLHLQPALSYLGHRLGDFPVSEAASKRYLSLPIYPELTEADVEYIAKELIHAVEA
jgi:dTDP-4-amino-4,6-dideoxygalactose transaminase